MPQDLGEEHSDIFDRVIRVDSIEQTELGGYPALKVTDTAGNEYTSFKDTFRQEVVEDKKKYVGEVWQILFTVYKGQYLSFQGFTEPRDEEEAVGEEIDINDFVDENAQVSPTDRQITRQSAAHDASRIVQGMLADGQFKRRCDRAELRGEIQEELEYWTERFKQHHRTGEWRSDTGA